MGEAKSALRKSMRAVLRRLSDAERSSGAIAIEARVTALPVWREPGTIALYANLPGEIATAALMEAAWSAGHRVLLPRVLGEGGLEFAEHRVGAPLVPGAFDVPEPSVSAPVVDLAEADLILVPGLAFDRLGGRLGRGAGYYDRALAASGRARARGSVVPNDRGRLRTIGLALERQIVDAVPVDAHDVPLDAVVTPRATYARGR